MMDPRYISLMTTSIVGQATPLPPGIGGTLSPMMIPLATSDTAMSSFSGGQPTISMIQTMAEPTAQMMIALAPPPDIPVSAPAPVQPQVPPVNLYKCSTGASSEEVTHEPSERNKERASLDLLQKSYNELNSRKIKDPLSSFLPDIPGEFDSSEPPGTMLLDLVEHKPIGGKEFLPLSGQALLGFRLLPGPLPEQLRIDPPSMNDHIKSHKKRKHKHKTIDRSEDKSDGFLAASKPSKLPSDAYSFIKHETHAGPFPMMPTAETVLHSGGVGSVAPTTQLLQQQQVYASAGPPTHIASVMPQVLGDKKKKKKRDKEKKKKDKKKRRHHDPPGHPSHPLPHSHPTPPPPSSTHFSHTHS